MRGLTDKINQKAAAVDVFQTKSTIDGDEVPFQPKNIQREQPLKTPDILKDNQEANSVLEEARKDQLELNAKMAKHAEKLAKLALAEFIQQRYDLFLEAMWEVSYALAVSHRRKHKTTATVDTGLHALIACKKVFTASTETIPGCFTDDQLKLMTGLTTINRERITDQLTAVANDHAWIDYVMSTAQPPDGWSMFTDDVFADELKTKIATLIDKMTVEVWKNTKEVADQKSIDEELAALFKKKATVKANDNLAEAMDVDEGEEKLTDRMKQIARDVVKQQRHQDEAKARKKSTARSQVHLRKAGNGHNTNDQSGRRKQASSTKQSSTSRTTSTKQKQKQKSILKKGKDVRFSESEGEEEESDDEESYQNFRRSSRRSGGSRKSRGGRNNGGRRGKNRRN